MNLSDLTLLTVSFNNNLLTGMMLKSFSKQTGIIPKVVIVDNGDKIPVDKGLKSVFKVIDNFNHKLLSDEIQPSRNHCKTIDYALKNEITTKWCLLVDNDILFKNTLKSFLLNFDTNKYDSAGEIGFDIIPPNRLYPYFCLINIDKFLKEKIDYYNKDFCMKLFDKNGNELKNSKFGHSGLYDTGYYFYEQIKNWSIQKIHINDLCVHLKNGSFGNRNINDFLNKNKNLY